MIYDITRELFSSEVYPGDRIPRWERVKELSRGDECTLTDISMCVHNGTHADAPAHYIAGGKTIDQLDLSRFIGECTVIEPQGEIGAKELKGVCASRVLIKGIAEFTEEGAEEAKRFLLVGTEKNSVGNAQVHKILLGAEVAILEGLDLSKVPAGNYKLVALPMKLGASDGASVRAALLSEEEI